MRLYNINGKVYALMNNIYSQVQYVIKTNDGLSKPISSQLGVKQGCNCSPTLFNIYVNDLKDYLASDKAASPTMDEQELTHLLFADDLVLLSRSCDFLIVDLFERGDDLV